jgi:hypothetical protein
MGLKDLLTTTGSPYSAANGGNISTNVLATNQSPLHYNGVTGYSLDGADQSVPGLYNQYNDGDPTPLKQPTTLDLLDPTSTPTFTPTNTYTQNAPQ